jgi:hypothetical protein
MPTEPQKCTRCRQPLPEGSGFCVTCGHTNESAMMDRLAQTQFAIDKRQQRLGFWKSITDALSLLRIFTR